jgi:hypothetical protein
MTMGLPPLSSLLQEIPEYVNNATLSHTGVFKHQDAPVRLIGRIMRFAFTAGSLQKVERGHGCHSFLMVI